MEEGSSFRHPGMWVRHFVALRGGGEQRIYFYCILIFEHTQHGYKPVMFKLKKEISISLMKNANVPFSKSLKYVFVFYAERAVVALILLFLRQI